MEGRPDPADLRAKLLELLTSREEIDFAYLFGSFADGLPYHDVDVGVFLHPALEPSTSQRARDSAPQKARDSTVLNYEMGLSVELTLALHVEVDVHVLNSAPRGFQHAVLQGEPLLVRDEERLTDFIEDVGWDIMEFSYHAKVYLQEVLTWTGST